MSDRINPTPYGEALAGYRTMLGDLGYDVGDARSEHHLECLQDWSTLHTLDEIRSWFSERRNMTTMTVEDIPLRDARGWSMDPDTGDVSHDSGDFFSVHGIRVRQSASREVGEGGWDQPILEQVGYDGGLLGILRKRFDGVPHYLIEAKAEPGNYEIVQMSPTLQATFSNLRRAHEGRKPRFAEVFEEPESVGGTVLYAQWLSEDGGRLHKKRNFGMLVEVGDSYDPVLTDDFIWMSMHQIKACLYEDAWVNPHIRGIIAHL
jgi:oxidase EvaA